jgi:hypothetical protein
VPPPLEPVPGAAQLKSNVRKTLDTTRKRGRYVMAFRGGLLAKATIRRRPLPVRIGFSDQLGDFWCWIAFSAGMEFIVSQWSARFLFRAPSP